jgi:hypothetical protein
MNVKLTKEEADKLRKKKIMLSYHSAMRWMYRLNFRKIEDVIQNGEIFLEGRNKFRAVLPIKRQKIAYVIFVEFQDCIYVKTVGVARK